MIQVSTLEYFVVGEVFAFLFIFARLGGAFMVLPGFAEIYVNSRARLMLAVMFSIALVPMLKPYLPEIPASPALLLVLLLAETLVGVFFGMLSRFMIISLHIAGSVISYQSSLAIATLFDAGVGGQTTTISNFLGLSALVFIFAMDLHHVMIIGLVESYQMFIPGEFPVIGDMANTLAQLVTDVFRIGIQIATPHMVFAMLFYLGSGVLARLMPNMQVFFVIMPLHITVSFFILLAGLPTILLTLHEFMNERLTGFLAP